MRLKPQANFGGKLDLKETAETQLFHYASIQSGISMIILTDGNWWYFFNAYGAGDYQERKVKSFAICSDDAETCIGILERYLRYAQVKFEQAFEDLRDDYQQLRKAREAKMEISNIWQDLVDAEEEILIDLIAELVTEKCEYCPQKTDIIEFLQKLKLPQSPSFQPSSPQQSLQSNHLSPVSTETFGSQNGNGQYGSVEYRYKIAGIEEIGNSGIDVYMKILDHVFDQYDFFAELKSERFNKLKSRNYGTGYQYSEHENEIPKPFKFKRQLAKTKIWVNSCISASSMEGKLAEVGDFHFQKLGRKILGRSGSGVEIEYLISMRPTA